MGNTFCPDIEDGEEDEYGPPDPITGIKRLKKKKVDGVAPGPTSPSAHNKHGSGGGGGGVPTAAAASAGGGGASGAPKAQSIPAKKLGYLLEEEVPLRQSVLWDLQRSFYDEMNINCWSKAVVPNFVTSNAFVARSYAKVILEFMRDWIKNPYIYVDRKETPGDKGADKTGATGGGGDKDATGTSTSSGSGGAAEKDSEGGGEGKPRRPGGVSRHSKGRKRARARRGKRRMRVVDPGKPFYIVEVGAGAGKLAYLIVRRLLTLVDEGFLPSTLLPCPDPGTPHQFPRNRPRFCYARRRTFLPNTSRLQRHESAACVAQNLIVGRCSGGVAIPPYYYGR